MMAMLSVRRQTYQLPRITQASGLGAKTTKAMTGLDCAPAAQCAYPESSAWLSMPPVHCWGWGINLWDKSGND